MPIQSKKSKKNLDASSSFKIAPSSNATTNAHSINETIQRKSGGGEEHAFQVRVMKAMDLEVVA